MPRPAPPACLEGFPFDRVRPVPYAEIAAAASRRLEAGDGPRSTDPRLRFGLFLIDLQNTFCLPGFELFVAGAGGRAAVSDSERLCSFIYANMDRIAGVVATLDTHRPAQLFHPCFLVDDDGAHPKPYTSVTVDDLKSGRWRFNRRLRIDLPLADDEVDAYLVDYARRLSEGGRFDWTIWPYHALAGTPGHALVSAVEAALFFHGRLHGIQPQLVFKGEHPLTEHYSALGPEVVPPSAEAEFTRRRRRLLQQLDSFEALVVAGQAKSHCVAWTVRDLLDSGFRAEKIYLLQDCTSPVVAGSLDFTAAADEAFAGFEARGAHLVRSDQSPAEWPGMA